MLRPASPPRPTPCRSYREGSGAFQATYNMLLVVEGPAHPLTPWARVLRAMMKLREWSRAPERTERRVADARLVSRFVSRHGDAVDTLFPGEQGDELYQWYSSLGDDIASSDVELMSNARSAIEHYHGCAMHLLLYDAKRQQMAIAQQTRRVRRQAQQRPGDSRPVPALLVAHFATTTQRPDWY